MLTDQEIDDAIQDDFNFNMVDLIKVAQLVIEAHTAELVGVGVEPDTHCFDDDTQTDEHERERIYKVIRRAHEDARVKQVVMQFDGYSLALQIIEDRYGYVVVAPVQARGEPDFIKHEVETPSDWSDWVCPNPSSYFMKCCDCGLVHEAQFKVVKYNNDEDHQDCEDVEDQNLQAVFRMRRSEQWEPTDMAHRVGGMSIDGATAPAQAQGKPVADEREQFESHWLAIRGAKKAKRELVRHPLQPQCYTQDSANRHWVTWQAAINALKARLGETE